MSDVLAEAIVTIQREIDLAREDLLRRSASILTEALVKWYGPNRTPQPVRAAAARKR